MTTGAATSESRPRSVRLPIAAQERALWQHRLNALPVLTDLGAELDLSDEAVVRIRLVHSRPSHFGGLGTGAVNGATIAALVDCGIAATGIVLFRGRTCGTLHLSIDFMKAVRAPDPELECRVVRRTDALAFVEARLCGAGGSVLVQASGIVAIAKSASGDMSSWATLSGAQELSHEAAMDRLAANPTPVSADASPTPPSTETATTP